MEIHCTQNSGFGGFCSLSVQSQRQRPCLENGSQCCCVSGLGRFASSIGALRRRAGRSVHALRRATENAFAAARRRAMHEAAGAPPQLTDGACEAAQSTGAAASRPILQARPLALRVHRERAIVDKSTDLWAADLHVGRALRKDNRGPRILARTRTRRASCRPGGGRPSSPPERPCPGSAMRGGLFPSVHSSTKRRLIRVAGHYPAFSGQSRRGDNRASGRSSSLA